jgi:hypothetical protein
MRGTTGKWTVVSGFSFSRLDLVGAVGIEIASLTSKSRWQKALPAAPQTNC